MELLVARFKHKCAGVEIKINDVDHEPPHCHVFWVQGRNVRVRLDNLEVLWDDNVKLPAPVRKCLQQHVEEMRQAWNDVVIENGTS